MRNINSAIAYEVIYISFNSLKWGHIVRDTQTREEIVYCKPGLPIVKLEPDAKVILNQEAREKAAELYW